MSCSVSRQFQRLDQLPIRENLKGAAGIGLELALIAFPILVVFVKKQTDTSPDFSEPCQ